MEYIKAFKYFALKKGNGFKNVLMLCVCSLIPVVGNMILMGYSSQVGDRLEEDPELESYPDFTFDRFMNYLTAGIWPFVTALIFNFAVFVPLYFLSIIVGVLFAILTDRFWVGFVGYFSFFLFMMPIITIMYWPVEIYAKKRKAFEFRASMSFARDFLRRVGTLTVVTVLIHGVLSTFAIIAGLLCLFVGVYPAAVIVQLAHQHFQSQLYLKYLDAGGEPVLEDPSYRDNDRPAPRRADPI